MLSRVQSNTRNEGSADIHTAETRGDGERGNFPSEAIQEQVSAWTSKARGKIRLPLATCMTSPEPSQGRLEIDVETWSKRDLIQVISSRYFILGDPETGEFSWRVNAIGGDSEK